jgi:hypothetical protein
MMMMGRWTKNRVMSVTSTQPPDPLIPPHSATLTHLSRANDSQIIFKSNPPAHRTLDLIVVTTTNRYKPPSFEFDSSSSRVEKEIRE